MRAEIESERADVQRAEEALREHEQMSRASGKQVTSDFDHNLVDSCSFEDISSLR